MKRLLPDLLADRAKPLWQSEAASFAPPSVPLLRLGGGVPDPVAVPLAGLEEGCRLVLEREGDDALQYGGPQGYAGLREMLAQRIGQQEATELTAANFMLAGGAAQALAAVCFAFLDPGDVVISEDPTFPGSLRTFRAHQVELVGVPFDEEGPVIDVLEASLQAETERGRRTKLLYFTPNAQNPTGISFSLPRRQAIVDLVSRYDCLIVEDDAYGELRYDGHWLPSLYTLAGGQGVVRLGTFSKTIGPGLRLGWTQASAELTQVFTSMRLDMGTSPFLARVVAAFAENGHYDRHVEELVSFYRDKRDKVAALLERYCGEWASWRVTDSGFFFWLELGPGLDADALAKAAYNEGVSVASGNGFFCGEPAGNFLRLAFSYVAIEEMEEAVRRLARAAEKLLTGPPES